MAKASASLVTARQLIAIFCQRPERTIPSYRFVLFPDVRSNGPDLFGYGHRHPHQFGDISHPHFFEHPGAVHLNCLFVNAKSTPDLLVQPTSDYVAQTVGADGRPCPAVPLSRRRAMSALGQSRHSRRKKSCPLYSQKRIFGDAKPMSALGQKSDIKEPGSGRSVIAGSWSSRYYETGCVAWGFS
jgi:hypothetical protein